MERRLLTWSVVWLVLLVLLPGLHAVRAVFAVTLCLVACNAWASFVTLTRRRVLLTGLNGVQILLFACLHWQLCAAFGPEHYHLDCEPALADWLGFTFTHVCRAADVIDALDEFGIELHPIRNRSTTAGLLLVSMHIGVNIFLLGVVVRWLGRFWRHDGEPALERGRRICGFVIISVVMYLLFGAVRGLRWQDWFLWPLENALRLVDIGDCFQVFDWRLHGVSDGFGTQCFTLVFRTVLGYWFAKAVWWLRVTRLGAWGASIDDLVETLHDGEAHARAGAARALGRCGACAADAVADLRDALGDPDFEVRRAAATALGDLGSLGCPAVALLARMSWSEHRELAHAAVHALGQMGPAAGPAFADLCFLLPLGDRNMKKEVVQALGHIAPDLQPQLWDWWSLFGFDAPQDRRLSSSEPAAAGFAFGRGRHASLSPS